MEVGDWCPSLHKPYKFRPKPYFQSSLKLYGLQGTSNPPRRTSLHAAHREKDTPGARWAGLPRNESASSSLCSSVVPFYCGKESHIGEALLLDHLVDRYTRDGVLSVPPNELNAARRIIANTTVPERFTPTSPTVARPETARIMTPGSPGREYVSSWQTLLSGTAPSLDAKGERAQKTKAATERKLAKFHGLLFPTKAPKVVRDEQPLPPPPPRFKPTPPKAKPKEERKDPEEEDDDDEKKKLPGKFSDMVRKKLIPGKATLAELVTGVVGQMQPKSTASAPLPDPDVRAIFHMWSSGKEHLTLKDMARNLKQSGIDIEGLQLIMQQSAKHAPHRFDLAEFTELLHISSAPPATNDILLHFQGNEPLTVDELTEGYTNIGKARFSF